MPDPGPEDGCPAGRVGLGWGWPLRWQGWLTLALYAALTVGTGLLSRHGRNATLHDLIIGTAPRCCC